MKQTSKTKRFIALFVAITMMASLFTMVSVSAQETVNLGAFNYVGGNNWTHRWNTDNTDDNAGLVSMHDFARATHLVLNFSGNPETDVELMVWGEGNNWNWTNMNFAWSPADILEEGAYTATLDLTAHPNWAAVAGGESASIVLGGVGLANTLSSAHLVVTGAPAAAAPVETPVAPVETPVAPVEAPPVETTPVTPVPITANIPAAPGQSVLQLTIGSTTYVLDGVSGTNTDFDVAPFIGEGDRTMVPFRFIGETLGAQIEWNQATETAIFIDGATRVEVTLGQRLYDAAGAYMGTPVQDQTNWRTMVPLRFVSERLGATVDWIPPGTAVVIFGDELPIFEEPIIEEPADDEDDADYENGEEEYADDEDENGDDEDENGDDDENGDENGDDEPVEVVAGQPYGHVLRHEHSVNRWGQIVLLHNFTNDEYTITFDVLHGCEGVGVDPAYQVANSWNFMDGGEVLATTRAYSPAGQWSRHTFTFPGAIAAQTDGLQIGTEYPRTVGSAIYIDNVVVTNSAGTVVFENDFESNTSGFGVREWSEDSQSRVTAP